MILTIKDPHVFDAILSGKKRYEGRKWKEDYALLKEGDVIVFVLEGSTEMAVTRVVSILRFSSVREMVETLWKQLLPTTETVEEALKYYSSFYNLSDPAIAIEIEVMSKEVVDGRALKKWLGISLPDTLRVAVSVDEEGNVYSGHFGDAPYFYIYECGMNGCKLLEKRKNTVELEEEQHGDPRKFKQVYNLLSDTDVWCGFRMGPNYLRIVNETEIVPFLTGTRDLETALNRLRRKYLSLSLRRICKWR